MTDLSAPVLIGLLVASLSLLILLGWAGVVLWRARPGRRVSAQRRRILDEQQQTAITDADKQRAERIVGIRTTFKIHPNADVTISGYDFVFLLAEIERLQEELAEVRKP